MTRASQSRLLAHHAIAEALLSLAGDGLSEKQNKGYIVLEHGQSALNKNAVSLIREGVSFMVEDWGAEQKAQELRLKTKRSKRYERRLVFPDLSLSDVQSNSDFFADLTRKARSQSANLQSGRS